MKISPKVREFLCLTAHPEGCQKNVENQITYVKKHSEVKNGPKKVLIIGASTGYGLASRINAAFGCGAATIGVMFERQAAGKRTARAGIIQLHLSMRQPMRICMPRQSTAMHSQRKSKIR